MRHYISSPSILSNLLYQFAEDSHCNQVTRYGFQSRAEATTDPMAVALGHDSQPLQPVMKDIVTKARATWLKNDEVLKVLLHYKSYQLPIGKEAPKSPGGVAIEYLMNGLTVITNGIQR